MREGERERVCSVCCCAGEGKGAYLFIFFFAKDARLFILWLQKMHIFSLKRCALKRCASFRMHLFMYTCLLSRVSLPCPAHLLISLHKNAARFAAVACERVRMRVSACPFPCAEYPPLSEIGGAAACGCARVRGPVRGRETMRTKMAIRRV